METLLVRSASSNSKEYLYPPGHAGFTTSNCVSKTIFTLDSPGEFFVSVNVSS